MYCINYYCSEQYQFKLQNIGPIGGDAIHRTYILGQQFPKTHLPLHAFRSSPFQAFCVSIMM